MHYRIQLSTDLKVIGWSPQIQSAVFPVNLDSDPRSTKSFWYEKADLQKLVFPEPILESKAKLLDFISCSVIGNRFMPLVSQKFKNIIESSDTLDKPQFIPTKVHHRNKIYDNYYYLNAYEFKYECIDLQKSLIKWDYGYAHRQKNVPITISSYGALMDILKALKPPVGISIYPLVLNEESKAHDFFSLSWVKGGVGYYISEFLKKALEDDGVTGIEFYDINEGY